MHTLNQFINTGRVVDYACLVMLLLAGWLTGRVGGDAAGVLLRSAVHDAVANTDK